MAVRFTQEQQRVIDVRDCNVLVSAAAGSGKTASRLSAGSRSRIRASQASTPGQDRGSTSIRQAERPQL